MDKVKNADEHIWYAEQVAKNGWSRNVLVHQIESWLYQRQALAEKVSNFESRLPSPQSELAAQTMKDPYIFDFIPFKEDMIERDIEQALVKDVTKLLLELGTGFAFLGNQYHLNVGGDDFYIDLLFYNLNLRCYVVIELKTGEFKPEYAGRLNFYLSAVDGILKKEQDNPSIGLLLCKSKNDLLAEYSLKDMSKPIGVSAYQITSNLPEELERQLPSVEDIQKRIKGDKRPHHNYNSIKAMQVSSLYYVREIKLQADWPKLSAPQFGCEAKRQSFWIAFLLLCAILTVEVNGLCRKITQH